MMMYVRVTHVLAAPSQRTIKEKVYNPKTRTREREREKERTRKRKLGGPVCY